VPFQKGASTDTCKEAFLARCQGDDNSDLIMTEKDISLNLQAIIEDAAQTPLHEAAKS
jgi:hypothetical protein